MLFPSPLDMVAIFMTIWKTLQGTWIQFKHTRNVEDWHAFWHALFWRICRNSLPSLPLRFWAYELKPRCWLNQSTLFIMKLRMEGVGACQECRHPTPQVSSHALLHWRTLRVTCLQYLPFRWGCLVSLDIMCGHIFFKRGHPLIESYEYSSVAHADFAAQFRCAQHHAQLLIHRARMCVLQLDSMYFHLHNNPMHMKDPKCFSHHRLSLKRSLTFAELAISMFDFRTYKLSVSTLHAWLSPMNANKKLLPGFVHQKSLQSKPFCWTIYISQLSHHVIDCGLLFQSSLTEFQNRK